AYDVDVPGLEYTVVRALREKGLHAATAESCTGGMIAEKLTNVPGSSEVFGYGFVTYAEAAKQAMLGVDAGLIERYSVVSGPVAVAMARGALKASGAELAVGVTGIAGPGGALPGKPVGTVYLAGADARNGKSYLLRLPLSGYGERNVVRIRAALWALDVLRRMALDLPVPGALETGPDAAPETLNI
ncbi:MAG: CinA family protein, partial [Gemmiger sp.]